MKRGLPIALVLGVSVSACGAPVAAPTTPAASAAFAMPLEAPSEVASPITLTAADGTGLAIASLAVRARSFGPLAETELRVRFHHAGSSTIEGRFRLALPARSFVSRLAMRIDGTLREADVVELPLARSAYEDILHARRDPLLVEQKDDNEISARVFPILPDSDREIVVAWISEVDARTPLTIPLKGLPKIGELAIDVRDDHGTQVKNEYELGAEPRDDIRVPASPVATALRHGEAFVARVRAPFDATPERLGSGLVVLVDTSASRAPDFEEELALVRGTVAELAAAEPDARLVVAAFDQEVAVVHDGVIGAFGDASLAEMRARGALGASDLERALGWAAKAAARAGAKRVVLVSDGLATAGTAERDRLVNAAKALGAAGVERLDAIPASRVSDDGVLRALVRGTLPRDGVVVTDTDDPKAIASRLRLPTVAALDVEVPGARWVWPRTLVGLQAGEERFVYAELPETTPARVVLGGRTVESFLDGSPLAGRAVSKARVDALVDRAERDGWTDAGRAEVVALARRERVPSPLTALLVLESEADREALAVRRGLVGKPRAAPGSARTGRHFVLPPPHRTKPPQIRGVATSVNGRIPPESIRKTIRQNIGRFRGCYTEGLLRNANLRGRVVTDFVLARDGSVETAVDAGSDLPDARVVACIVDAFKALHFPEPDGMRVTIRYPLRLRPRSELVDEGDPAAADEVAWPDVRGQKPRVFSWPGKSPEPSPRDPWSGVYGATRSALAGSDVAGALAVAVEGHARHVDDVGAMLALGEAFEAAGMPGHAARAYGSIADIYPHRADMLRVAGGRLAALGGSSLSLAIELLRRAQGDRPDQPSSHQLLAMAWLAAGHHAEALATLDAAAELPFAARYVGAARLFREERAFVEALQRGADRPPVEASFAAALLDTPSTLVVATWESDASDVAIAAADAEGKPLWPATVASSNGFGPNAGVLMDSPHDLRIGVRLERRGPTGDAFGLVHVLTHDGHGHVRLRTRPFAVMNEGATVSL